mmetsp:Transcript_5484/g.8522  ORF Transcript_5484/g.8522 Transcript_5484/m.8522 type:complete len:120 (-) Transcript_5484:358-717(-)
MLKKGIQPLLKMPEPGVWLVPSQSANDKLYIVPKEGGCNCPFARKSVGKMYCKHEALLCLYRGVDPKSLLPESNQTTIESATETRPANNGTSPRKPQHEHQVPEQPQHESPVYICLKPV